MACLSHRSKVYRAFFIQFFMEKDFKYAACLIAVWAFIGYGLVLLGQAWGFLPITNR